MQAVIAWFQAGRLLRRQFPSPPVDNIIAGHAVAMQSPKNHRWLSDTYRQLGPLFYVRLAHNHVKRPPREWTLKLFGQPICVSRTEHSNI